MRKVMLLGVCVLLVCIALAPAGRWIPEAAAAPAHLLEVGTSPTCAYHTIADAIAAAQPRDTIKVENTILAGPPLVVDRDLTLAGGYNSAHPYSCLTLTGLGRTTYRRTGATAAPAIAVQNATLTMTWFVVEMNGNGPGVEVIDGDLTLEHVIVRDNDGACGGGVHAANSNITLRDSELGANTADYGGGLCVTAASTLVAERTLLRGNQAWTAGAGVYIDGGSTLTALDDTNIESNVTPFGCYEGGGIYATGAGTEVLLDASRVVSNTALMRGGGIYLEDGAAATLQNLARVSENRAFGPASGAGGGVLVTGAGTELTLRVGLIMDNSSDPVGGGIANYGGTVSMADSLVTGNSSRDAGGGIYNADGALHVRNTLVVDNEVTAGDGGGVYSTGADGVLDIVASGIIYNHAPSSDGGGVYASHRMVTVERSSLSNNTAIGDGSGLYITGACCADASAQIVNNVFLDNSQTVPMRSGPPAAGSALYVEGMEATLVHNTLALQAPQATFGVYVGPDASILMTNNILANFYIGIRRVSTSTGSAAADHTLFYGNTYDYDPGVVSTAEVHGDPLFTGDHYHLSPGSPAIDAGATTGIAIDYDGELRPWGPAPDIGADEYPPRASLYLPLVCRQ